MFVNRILRLALAKEKQCELNSWTYIFAHQLKLRDLKIIKWRIETPVLAFKRQINHSTCAYLNLEKVETQVLSPIFSLFLE